MHRQRLLNILLFFSLGVNIILIGYHAGRIWSHHVPSHEEVMESRRESFASMLPKEARHQLHEILEKRESEITQHMKEMKKTRQQISALVMTDPIDENAVSDAFAKLRAEHEETQKIYHDAFVEVTKGMDTDERGYTGKSLGHRHKDRDDD